MMNNLDKIKGLRFSKFLSCARYKLPYRFILSQMCPVYGFWTQESQVYYFFNPQYVDFGISEESTIGFGPRKENPQWPCEEFYIL